MADRAAPDPFPGSAQIVPTPPASPPRRYKSPASSFRRRKRRRDQWWPPMLGLRKQHNTPARPRRFHRRPDQAVAGYCQNDGIRPPTLGNLLYCFTVSELEASIFSFRPNALAIVCLCGNKSEVITRAPVRRANTARMMPIGPWPITRTVSPGLSRHGFNPFHAGIDRLDE